MDENRSRPPPAYAILIGALFLVALVVVFDGSAGEPPASTVAASTTTTPTQASTTTSAAPTATAGLVPAVEEEVVPGWSRIDGAPGEPLSGVVMVWTGRHVVVLGDTAPGGGGVAGAAYDTVARRWRAITPPPLTAAADAVTVWTGSEVIVATTTQTVAYDPAGDSWRTLPARPDDARNPVGAVWTGTEVVLIAHVPPRLRLADELAAIAYDPGAGSWRRLADPPLPMSYASVLWDEGRVVLVGGFLDQNDLPRSENGLATAQVYDTDEASWSVLGDLDLAPNAVTAALVPTGILAWEHGLQARLLGGDDAWIEASPVPIDSQECHPDGGPVAGLVFAWYCGQAALYLPETDAWGPIMVPPIEGVGSGPHALAAAGDDVFVWVGGSLWRFDVERARTASVKPVDIGGGWQLAPIPELRWRYDPSLVWTGNELIVWGGHGQRDEVFDGVAYDPLSGTSHRIPAADAPGRFGQKAVWTGDEMVVWRGPISAWSPQRLTWRGLAVPTEIVESVPSPAVGLWTGREVLFVGAGDGDSSGLGYDPVEDTWRSLAPSPLSARSEAAHAWSGQELYLWGGIQDSFWYQDGAAYAPFADEWRPLPSLPDEQRLSVPAGVWTGSELIVVGFTSQPSPNETPRLTGYAYDPETDRWRALASLPLMPAVDDPLPSRSLAAWIRGEVTVWLPAPFFGDTPQLGVYDPGTDEWQLSAHLPFDTVGSQMVFTGSELTLVTETGLLRYEFP